MRRTVEELETAGICAMSIEDTVLPRPYGSNGKPSLSSVEEGVDNMKAALSARQDKNLVIAGRTSALAIANLDEAVKRAKAYEMAGVDAIFLAGGAAITVDSEHGAKTQVRMRLSAGGRWISNSLGPRDCPSAARSRTTWSRSHCKTVAKRHGRGSTAAGHRQKPAACRV